VVKWWFSGKVMRKYTQSKDTGSDPQNPGVNVMLFKIVFAKNEEKIAIVTKIAAIKAEKYKYIVARYVK
jgi:hypothetical protein